MPPIALTIAGSDSSGGAGIQADLKVFAALGVYGASVLTAVTAQNTRGVRWVHPLPSEVITVQLDAVLDDLPAAATKVGMLATAGAANTMAARAKARRLPNLVLDPVLVSSSGTQLGTVEAVEVLLPYATVVTPNRDEASALLGWRVSTPGDMAAAAAELASRGPRCVVVTGGDVTDCDPSDGGESVDALWTENGARLLPLPRVTTGNTHGTGCAFSSAIAARLALGDAVDDAVIYAKGYVARALDGSREWRVGGGLGPLDHMGWSTKSTEGGSA